MQPDLREPSAAPAGSDDAGRALRGRRARRHLQAAGAARPARPRGAFPQDGDRPAPQRRRRLGISRRSRPLGARPVAPHQVGRRRHQPGRHLRGQAARAGSDAGARRAAVGVRQHERRRAALRGRRPLGLPEPGDGASCTTCRTSFWTRCRPSPTSSAIAPSAATTARSTSCPAASMAGSKAGCDASISPTSRPSGGAPRPAAPSRSPIGGSPTGACSPSIATSPISSSRKSG